MSRGGGSAFSSMSEVESAKDLRSEKLNTHLNSKDTWNNPEVEKVKICFRRNDPFILAQWNLRGLNSKTKTDTINSIDCNVLCLQEINHPTINNPYLILKDVLDCKERDQSVRGGGTLSLSNLPISSKKVIHVNKDSNLVRLVIDNIIPIWLCNIYLNKGSTKQIQKLFKTIQTEIPERERANLVIVGDFNVNISDDDLMKVKLITKICKTFSLQLLKPTFHTRPSSGTTLDFLITGSGISAELITQRPSLSDHHILYWKITLKPLIKLSSLKLPNRALGVSITRASILNDNVYDAQSLLTTFLQNRRRVRAKSLIKMKRRKWDNSIYREILVKFQEDASIMKEICEYWESFWDDIEKKRFSNLSKEAFDGIRLICKYHLFDKREGSLVNQLLQDNGDIICDPNEIARALINSLKKIQIDTELPQYSHDLPFPHLPDLEDLQIDEILTELSSGKAISYDLFSDTVLKDPQMRTKLKPLLRNLWSDELNKIPELGEIFKSRLVALNKVHPKIPTCGDFRPIIVMSAIVKIMESRWLPKLKAYLVERLCPCQTGFVTGQGIFSNITRAINRIKSRTDSGKNVFGLFIDFKSAYNFARHDILFDRLNGILTPEEIAFQKAIYDKITIHLGSSSFSPNVGVAQGSILSPAFFDIYSESLLWELHKLLPLDDIFAYADDILILCEDKTILEKCIKIIEEWSSKNNLQINKNKSAIVEYRNRRSKKTNLQVGNLFLGYPILDSYKYLGTHLNSKLSLKKQLDHISRKTHFIKHQISPLLYHASLKLKQNLWNLFVRPLFEFALPLYYVEKAISNKKKLDSILRSTFREFVGLKRNVEVSIIETLLNYHPEEVSAHLQYINEAKWEARKLGEIYIPQYDPNPLARFPLGSNPCKYLPKDLIKYVNTQTCLCPCCKAQGFSVRCNSKHLKKYHDIRIVTFDEILGQTPKIQSEPIANLIRANLKILQDFLDKSI